MSQIQRFLRSHWQPKYWLLAFLGIPLIVALLFATLQPIKVLPRIRLAPGFSFVDHHGERLTSEDMRGAITLYTFSYTRCAPHCGETRRIMQTVQQRLDEVDTRGIPVELVTVSFDPEHDTPAVLNEYAQQVGANYDDWRFATGTPALLKSAIGAGFRTYYERNEDGSFYFDPVFVLVDTTGIIRNEYRTGAPDIDILLRDIGLIAKEVREAKGANRVAYEAAHLFLCYPDG